MALFSRKPKTEEAKPAAEKPKAAPEKKAAPAKPQAPQGVNVAADRAGVLRNPRITEKATDVQQGSVYTFDVAEGATKNEIAEAVRAVYSVTPRKVAVVRIPAKLRRNMRTGKSGVKRGGKKAYVYLKKGETITIH